MIVSIEDMAGQSRRNPSRSNQQSVAFYFRVLLSTAILVCIAINYGCTPYKPKIESGRHAPDFKINSINNAGKEISLSRYKGKIVILNFLASWCSTCKSDLPSLVKLYSQLKDKGLIVIGIGVKDSIPNLKKMISDFSVDFPVGLDSKGYIGRLYRVTGVPESFIIGRDGKFKVVGKRQDEYDNVRIVGAVGWTDSSIRGAIERLLIDS